MPLSSAAFSLDHSSCHKMFKFLSCHIWPKKDAWHLHILFINDLVVSASRKMFRLISLKFMRFVAFSIGVTFLLLPVTFVPIFKLSRPHILTSERVQYSTPGLFLSGMMCFFVNTDFILWKIFFLHFSISVLLRPSLDSTQVFELILLLGFIFIDQHVYLWTLIISTYNLFFCLFTIQFQPFLFAFFFNKV